MGGGADTGRGRLGAGEDEVQQRRRSSLSTVRTAPRINGIGYLFEFHDMDAIQCLLGLEKCTETVWKEMKSLKPVTCTKNGNKLIYVSQRKG